MNCAQRVSATVRCTPDASCPHRAPTWDNIQIETWSAEMLGPLFWIVRVIGQEG
jgi:hypothetical protein